MDAKTRSQIARVLYAAADALDGGAPVTAKHRVGQKVWYDGKPAKVVKVGLKGPFGDDSIEIKFEGDAYTLKTGPLDHRLTEKKNQKKPTLSELLHGRDRHKSRAAADPVKVAKEAISPMADNAQDMRDDDDVVGAYGYSREEIYEALDNPRKHPGVALEALERQLEDEDQAFFWMPENKRFTEDDARNAIKRFGGRVK